MAKDDSDKPVSSENQEKPDDMDDSEEPNFSDPEDYVDEIDDAGFLVDVLMMKPTQDDGIDNIIVVDNVPEVGADRLEKLQNVLRKLYSKYGKVVNEFYPVDDNGVTKGFMFLEYSCPSHAQEAVKMTNGYKLDKQHTFHVNLFTDFDKYENIPKNWVPPEPQPYEDHGNLRQYLEDPDCFDQFSVIYQAGDKVAIYLNSVPEPTLMEERSKWTETYVRWSPLGTYLATFHPRGIALWGGPSFSQVMKFSHQGVQFIDFSPCEKYLVTLSPTIEERGPQEPQTIFIWDIRTGKKKRGFHSGISHVWPLFKWSHDDKYFAKISPDMLSVFETSTFGILDKKSFKIQGIRDFSWSPTSNIIAYWVAEEKDIPARVTLLNIPGRQEIRVKNLFNVADCKMHWQKFGDYLCVKVDRYVKSRKGERDELKYSGIYHNFEIFHLQEKQIPVDSVEIKETVHAFAWEPVGSKFAVIHGDSPNISVSFYSVKTGQTPSLLKKFEKEACNHLFWGPQGQFIVLAGLRSMNGMLKFIDTKDFTVMNSGEHFMATDVEWDPTGRYIVTGVSWWGNKVDNGYWLWTFQGKVLQRQNLDSFCQLLWRPRPPTLLSSQQIKDIKKNLKEKYSPQFDLKDKMRLSKESKELVEKRRKLMAEFEDYRERAMEMYMEQKKRRRELRNNVDTDELESDQLEEETVEFLVKEEEVFC